MPDSIWSSRSAGPGGLKRVGSRGGGTDGSWKVVLQVALFGILASGLLSCAALPGGSLDPLVPALGLPRGEGTPVQPPSETSAPAEGLARGPSQPSHEVQPRGEPATRSGWIGRYRDNRGEGEIALMLTQDGRALGGTWRLRTGGSGTFAGTLAPDGPTLAFTLQGSNQECPADLAGRGEYLEDRIRGTYTGSDCMGPIIGGSLELRRR